LGVFRGLISPDFGTLKSGTLGHISLYILGISGISGNFDLKTPVSQKPPAKQGTLGFLGKLGISGIQEILGTLFIKLSKFPKISKPEIPGI
jgi:hypothetical protein